MPESLSVRVSVRVRLCVCVYVRVRSVCVMCGSIRVVVFQEHPTTRLMSAPRSQPAISEFVVTTNDCSTARADMAKDKKKKGPPPADYVCAACKEGGHWVFDCTQVLLLLLLFFPPRLCCCIE